MQRTKIEWADYSWNPIKGICPVGCWYCYGRKIYKRFKLGPEPWLDIAELNMAIETRRTRKRVFVCSTFELFHPAVDKLMGRCGNVKGKRFLPARDMIFNVIERRPDLTFIILTKMPERIDCPMPDNVWLGVSIPTNEDEWRTDNLFEAQGRSSENSKVFISCEPMLDDCRNLVHSFDDIDWLIIGRLTGCGKKHNPKREWIEFLVKEARFCGLPIFLKNNLKEIWGEPLIQEFPE